MCEWVASLAHGPGEPSRETYLGEGASEADDWERWHRMQQLRAQVLGSSAAQRLLRKRRFVTNAGDQTRYKAAGDLTDQAFSGAVPEECPVLGYDKEAPQSYPIDLTTWRRSNGTRAKRRPKGKRAIKGTLKVSGAEEHIWRWAKSTFRCPACSSGVLPKPARPATIPRCYAPNVVVAVDLFELPTWNNDGSERYLNAVCLGTNFQMVEKVRSKQPGAVWAALARSWARVLGFPQIILLDQGTEFLGEFRQNAHDLGILIHTIGARAPRQNGRAERHGALFKAMFQKALWANPATSSEDYKVLLREVESAKNRLSDRSGFSPAQRMLGETPRTTGELLADEMVDVVLKGVTGEMEKRLQARRAAQKAFAEVNTSQAVRRAMRARARTQRTFRPGDVIFVWRSWKAQGIKKQAWVGPGVVVLPDGPNCYVNVKGRLWRVANEHVREGTSDEIRGIEAVHEVFQDLKERFQRPGRELGVVEDLTHAGDARGLPRARVEDPEPPVPFPEVAVPVQEIEEAMQEPPLPEPPVPEVPIPMQDLPRHVSQASAEEPEVERTASQPEADVEARVNAGQEAIQAARQLDGTPYGAIRPSTVPRLGASAPYLTEAVQDDYFEEPAVPPTVLEERAPEQHAHRDRWQFMIDKGVLRRHHVKWRSSSFSPWEAPKLPVPMRHLTSERSTTRVFKTGLTDQVSDDWKELKPSKRSHGKWKGYTDFYLTRASLVEAQKHPEMFHTAAVHQEFLIESEPPGIFAVKKGGDEIAEKDIKPEDWPEWKAEDAKEWSKIESSGAVRVLSPEESKAVIEQLTKEGKLDRIIDSRYVRRLKPGELVGEKPAKKSRWCVRGDQDPEAVDLNTYSPTVTTQNLQVILQCAASHRMPGSCGDLQAAFMQSAPLLRPGGKLYVRQPRSGLPGLLPEQLVEIVCGVYGLVDGPIHWRQTLKQFIVEELHFRQSRLDPTVFLLGQAGKLEGILVIEIDDILSFGYQAHDEAMARLRQRFKFGKFKSLQELPEGTTFNGRRIRQTPGFEILVDMEKYVQERLFPMKFEKGRRSNPEAEATADERQKARAVIGALAWAAKECRPDAAAAASMLASRLPTAKVKDLVDLNQAVEAVKAKSQLELRFFPIAPEDLGFGTVTDASWANHPDGGSQGATAVIAFDKALLSGARARCSLVWWKSGKLRRKVSSTLAAEAQSLNKGLGDLLWAKAIYTELVDSSFDLESFRRDIKSKADVVLQKSNADEILRESLSVIDAKSLYDNLVKDGNQPQDKFTALDVAIAREKIDGMGVQVRWVEHQSMIVDCLTEVKGSKQALFDLLESGTFRLEAEGELLEAWNDEPKMVNRWNTLIRLVAKRRRMQDVFQVYDAMRALWVRADHGTTEFIARAAVATVDLSGLVDSFHTMPPARYPEVVFVGWSNVGKSSLINSLLHRTAVAPVSTMPGKTTQFHFYTINEHNAAFPRMTLVDVPGIGEAMADEVQTRHWRRTLDLYLKERGPTLRQVFHLISCEVLLRRQKPSPLDISVMEMCLHHRSKFNLDYTLVITKIDLIRSKKDAETVYENLCKVVRRLRLGSAKIVPASVRSTTGRVLLWKRLWRSVDPENSAWHSSQDLSALRQEVERLVEAKDAEALITRAKEESGDGWECIVRGILALGRLRDAWNIIQAGPQRARGLEEQDTAEDGMENDMEMLKEGLLEAAEAGEEAAEDKDEEDAQEVSEEEAGADFFAMPEDLESEQMAAMQERAALAVGEAALAPSSDAGETLQGLAPRDPALAEEVAKMLSKEHRGAAAELLMEQVVASARLESLDSGQFPGSFGKLEALLKQAKEDAIFTPWSADRWNRLLRVVGSQGNLPAVERVLDYMSQFQVTGDQETDAVMAELVVSSVDLGGQAVGPCELDEGPGATPKVLFLGGRSFSSRKGGPDRAAIADAIVSTIPRRRIEDELAAVSREPARKTRGKKSAQQLDVPLASLLKINEAPSNKGSVPAVTLLSVPALQRPSVPTVEKELAASGGVSRNAARGGVWGSTLEAEEEVKSEAAAWRDGVCNYLSGPCAALLGGVFHVVDARDFAQKLSAEVPSHCRPGEEVFIQRRLETLLASKSPWLPADDRLVQAAALRARPKRYVLVVADCAQLSLGGSRRFLHQFYVLPFVAQQRRAFLREKLLQEVSAAAEAIQGERPSQISVLLADSEQFYHSWEFWRHFWSCATSTE
ncbi:engB [Symbiodinium sp. CCMP2592]|nr:engB [Symbiodinium sp. CCMP2592]